MTDHRCIICLETFSPTTELRRICPECNESRICQGCLNYVFEHGFEDQVSNCPICKRPTNYHFEPVLRPTLQFSTVGVWWWFGFPLTPWKVLTVMYVMYNLVRGLCVRQDRVTENSPRTLTVKWNVCMGIIHVPYFLYLFLPRDRSSEDVLLSEYCLCHIVSPLMFGLMIWIHKTASGLLGR